MVSGLLKEGGSFESFRRCLGSMPNAGRMRALLTVLFENNECFGVKTGTQREVRSQN